MTQPFEDADVQAAQNAYNQSAYQDQTPSNPPSNVYNDAVINAAQTHATSVATNAAQNIADDYKKQTATQSDHNEMPEPPNFCIRLFNCFPVHWFALFGGVLLITLPIVEIAIKQINFLFFLIYIYLIIFGVLTILVEAPTFAGIRRIQLGIFFWFRLMSRMWGRAWFYIWVSLICFRLNNNAFAIIVGVYLVLIAVLMFIYSRFAATKYARLYIFISAGAEDDGAKAKFEAKFDELDLDRDQFIGSIELVKVAAQSGRTLSNTEIHALLCFLDTSCNGRISKEDWMKTFAAYNLKQKFL